MNELISETAEQFAAAHTTPFDGALAAASNWTYANTSWPEMMAGLPEARLLEALIVVSGARSVLELGTFTGVGRAGDGRRAARGRSRRDPRA